MHYCMKYNVNMSEFLENGDMQKILNFWQNNGFFPHFACYGHIVMLHLTCYINDCSTVLFIVPLYTTTCFLFCFR